MSLLNGLGQSALTSQSDYERMIRMLESQNMAQSSYLGMQGIRPPLGKEQDDLVLLLLDAPRTT